MNTTNATGVPTPNQWLESKLRELGMSNTALGRLIGRSREEVSSWVNGRAQIPKHHLAEVAAQLGGPGDLEYAIMLKNCEDFADNLQRRLTELARIARCDSGKIKSATFELLRRKTSEECAATPDSYPSVLLYNMAHATSVFRQWCEAASTKNFRTILAPQNMKLHIQYPANHFLGLALNLDIAGGLMPDFRELGLAHLRDLAVVKNPENAHQLSGQHAVHMLARFGSSTDQALVSELIEDASKSTDPLCVRLGYAGLMSRPEHAHLVEKYVWLLRHDEALAFVDVLFEAVHYGDAVLGPDRTMPKDADHFEKSLVSILRRFEQPQQSDAIHNLESFRILELMDRTGPAPFFDPSLAPRLQRVLETLSSDDAHRHSELAKNLLAKLLHIQDLRG